MDGIAGMGGPGGEGAGGAAVGRTRRTRRTGRTRRSRRRRAAASPAGGGGFRRTRRRSGGGGRGGRGGGPAGRGGPMGRAGVAASATRGAISACTSTAMSPSPWITPCWMRRAIRSTASKPPSRHTPKGAATSCWAVRSRSPNSFPAAPAPLPSITRSTAPATAPPARKPCPRCWSARRFLAIHRRTGAGHDLRSPDRQSVPGEPHPHQPHQSGIARPAQVLPAPNAPGYKQNYQAPITTVQNSDNINSRINQTLNAKNRLNGGIGYQGSNNTTPNIFNFIDTGTGRNLTANISWGHNFSTRLINNLRYNFSRSRQLTSPFFAYKENIAARTRHHRHFAGAAELGPPSLSFTNYAGLSDGNSALTRNQTSGVGESLIWVRGVHNMTFGADYRRQQINRPSDPNARGQFTFTGAHRQPGQRHRRHRHRVRFRQFPAGHPRHQFPALQQQQQSVFPHRQLRRLLSPTTGASTEFLAQLRRSLGLQHADHAKSTTAGQSRRGARICRHCAGAGGTSGRARYAGPAG